MKTDTWLYYGHYVYRAAVNSSGIRWYTYLTDHTGKSDTKEGIRQQIKDDMRRFGLLNPPKV